MPSSEREEGLFFLPVVLGGFSVLQAPIEKPGSSLCAESVP